MTKPTHIVAIVVAAAVLVLAAVVLGGCSEERPSSRTLQQVRLDVLAAGGNEKAVELYAIYAEIANEAVERERTIAASGDLDMAKILRMKRADEYLACHPEYRRTAEEDASMDPTLQTTLAQIRGGDEP